MAHKKYPDKWTMREEDRIRDNYEFVMNNRGRFDDKTFYSYAESRGIKSVDKLFELIHK